MSEISNRIFVYNAVLFFVTLQVINIINSAQENSPVTVAEALDRVLEILRTTELYSPQLGTKDEDPHTSDLVGGLMTVSKKAIFKQPTLLNNIELSVESANSSD